MRPVYPCTLRRISQDRLVLALLYPRQSVETDSKFPGMCSLNMRASRLFSPVERCLRWFSFTTYNMKRVNIRRDIRSCSSSEVKQTILRIYDFAFPKQEALRGSLHLDVQEKRGHASISGFSSYSYNHKTTFPSSLIDMQRAMQEQGTRA